MEQASRCWCGNGDLVPFLPAYQKCSACETLVVTQMPGPGISRVTNDEQDFYGRAYWFSYQERELGNPNIIVRSRTDLPERCLHWLRTVLKYKLPPARVLELGSAHGGFVALLRWAGFEASGLELSPWAVELARQTFGVPMLLGPVEDQRIESGCLDVIVLMDVLEHLPDPVGTMRHCIELLKADGILVIQTPNLPEGKSYEEMLTQGDRFLELMKERGHLYLFSQRSIREFFHRLGVEYLAFESAMFADYDMFLVGSRAPLIVYLPEEIEKSLNATPGGRMVQALLDADTRFQQLAQRYTESEADRVARLKVIKQQGEEIAWLHGEVHRRNALEGQLSELQRQFKVVEADRMTVLAMIERQNEEIARLRQVLQAVQRTRVCQLLRRLGRWKLMDEVDQLVS